MNARTHLIARPWSWMEGEALRQLEQVAALPGMKRCVGLPDLHPGKGSPIGAAFLSDCVYPHLVGSDIGCGMALYRTNVEPRRFRPEKMAKRCVGLEASVAIADDVFVQHPWLQAEHLRRFDRALGTIGRGNHFAEFLIPSSGALDECVYLLVHSGSRGLGETILREHVDRHRSSALARGSDDEREYLHRHDTALLWAALNRSRIAERFAEAVGCEIENVLSVEHNFVERTVDGDFLHRKGAAPSDRGTVVIPGSRGTSTYVFAPESAGENSATALHSVAHGAGRKWRRGEAKEKLRDRYRVHELSRTASGGVVICEERDLLYEEAPDAYKKIENVVDDLLAFQLGTVVGTLMPRLTYKTRITQ